MTFIFNKDALSNQAHQRYEWMEESVATGATGNWNYGVKEEVISS